MVSLKIFFCPQTARTADICAFYKIYSQIYSHTLLANSGSKKKHSNLYTLICNAKLDHSCAQYGFEVDIVIFCDAETIANLIWLYVTN